MSNLLPTLSGSLMPRLDELVALEALQSGTVVVHPVGEGRDRPRLRLAEAIDHFGPPQPGVAFDWPAEEMPHETMLAFGHRLRAERVRRLWRADVTVRLPDGGVRHHWAIDVFSRHGHASPSRSERAIGFQRLPRRPRGAIGRRLP